MAGKSSIVKEFKEFIMRGNVLDMAIGVIIATAFGAITNSLISNIIMPLIGLLFGGIDLAKWDITLRAAVMDGDTVVKEAVVLGIGTFITTIINFILIALVVFAIVKAMNKVKDMKAEKEKIREQAFTLLKRIGLEDKADAYAAIRTQLLGQVEIIDAEKNPEMAREFGIMQAPTLVITDGEHMKKYVNASNIQKYVDEEL